MKNILTIAKKELRSFFNNPTAYIIILAFLLLWEFLFFRNVFLVGEASLRGLFELLPWIFLIVVPALTMGSLAEEKNDGTLEFLLTHPLKQMELIVGKFLGILSFVALTLLAVFPLAWSLGQFGNLDWGQVFGQYLAAVFAAAVLTSLGIFISGFFSSQISAFLISAIASFFLIISGTDLVNARLPLYLAPFFEQLSLSTHFDSMSRGVIDIRDLWYFVSFSAIFLVFAYLNLLKSKYGNKQAAYRNFQIASVLLVGIIILSNVVGSRIPGRLDLTQEKIYTLSAATKNIAGNLPDIVNISLYASAQLPSQFQPVLRETEDILNDYKTISNGKINIVHKNPSDDPAIAQEAASLGVQPVRFNVVSQEEYQVKDGYLGIAISYGGKHEAIPFVDNVDSLEYQLSGLIKKLTDENKPQIGFISGHGEKSLGTDYQMISTELGKQFEIKTIAAEGDQAGSAAPSSTDKNKKTSAAPAVSPAKKITIPDGLKALVIAGPTEDYSDGEKAAISDYLSKGGSALFLIDGVTISPQTMSAAANDKGLGDYLKSQFGVEVKKDLVYDLHSNETVGVGSGAMRYLLPYPFWIQAARVSSAFPITSKLESIVLPWTSSLTVDDSALGQAGFEKTELFATTELAGTQTANYNLSPDQKFSQQGLSRKVVALALSPKDGSGKHSRIVVVGDSNFLSDQFTTSDPGNFSFALETLSWLSQESVLSKIGVKNLIERKLNFASGAEPDMIKFGNMGLIFLVTAGYGTWRLSRRKKMKDNEYFPGENA